MTIDDRDALDAIKHRLIGAEAVLLLMIEHDTGENINVVRAAQVMIEDSLQALRALFKASPSAP